MTKDQQWVVLALTLAFFMLAGFNLYRDNHRHSYTLDSLQYAGLALTLEGKSSEAVHNSVYKLAHVHIPAPRFKALIGEAGGYQYMHYKRADYFESAFPFFWVKPAYVLTIFSLGKIGLDPFQAMRLISLASFVGMVVVAFLWMQSLVAWLLATAIVAAVFTRMQVLELATHWTPDAMSGFVVLLAFFLASRLRIRPALALAVFAVTIRPDNVIWVMLLCGYAAVQGRRRDGLLAGASALAVFGVINHFAYPWTALLYHTFVKGILEPQNFISPLTLSDYLTLYKNNALGMLVWNKIFLAAVFAGVVFLSMRVRFAGWRDRYSLLMAIALLHVGAHWLIMPAGKMRNMTPFCVVVLICIVKSLAEAAERYKKPMRPIIRWSKLI